MQTNWVNIVLKAMSLRPDLNVYFLTHSEDVLVDGKKFTKVKTIGKMIDEKITFEGLFTVVLQTEIVKKEDDSLFYCFKTNASDDSSIVKSPAGMFVDKYIPNDLNEVNRLIKEYE